MNEHDFLLISTTVGVRILIDVRAYRGFNISDWDDRRISEFETASDRARDVLLAHIETVHLVGIAPNLNPWEVF